MNKQINNIVANQNYQEREYWIDKLSGGIEKCILPYNKKDNINTRSMKIREFQLPDSLNLRLNEICKGSDPKLHILLVASINVFLNKYTDAKDIVVGIPIHKQDSEGDLLNTILAVRNYIEGGISFKQLLQQVHQSIVEAIKNQNYPIESILYKLGMQSDEFNFPLFDIVVFLSSIHKEEYIDKYATNFNFLFLQNDGKITLNINYNSEYYSDSKVSSFIDHYLFVLENLINNPENSLNSIDIILPEERLKLDDFNNTKKEISEEPIIRLMEKQAHKSPHRIGVCFKDEQISYQRFHNLANSLACLLQDKGVVKGTVIPVLIDHSVELIIAITAIMKTGGVFVPIDVHWPIERIKQVFKDLNCDMALVSKNSEKLLDSVDIENISVDLSELNNNNQYKKVDILPKDPLYIIYTSGSTGLPKGVVVPNIGITNRFDWMNSYFGASQKETVLHTTRYVYDSVVWQFFWPLINGGKTIIQDTDNIMDIDSISRLIAKRNISLMDFVPSIFNIIVDELDGGQEFYNRIKNLRNIVLGGEEISPTQTYKFKKLFPEITITNLYGPTEASIGCIYERVNSNSNDKIPIGKPIYNVDIFITNDNSERVPIGVAGEICISGVNLATGYLNDSVKTDSVFVENINGVNKIAYKTGDIGKYLEDGRIDFIGRKDKQLKIRGYRIEPGEIENKMISISEIKKAIVTIKEINNNKILCAYLVPEDEIKKVFDSMDNQESFEFETKLIEKLKEELTKELPEYMIPSYFSLIDEFPVSPSGKVDYKSLPLPQFNKNEFKVPPSTETESKLVKLWSGVLDLKEEDIGITSDFFEIGGHSLKATILLSKVHKEFNVRIPLIEIFKKSTIKEFSSLIDLISIEVNKEEDGVIKERIII